MTTQIIDIDLAEAYDAMLPAEPGRPVLALVRYRGRPVGTLRLAGSGGPLDAAALNEAVAAAPELRDRLAELLIAERLGVAEPAAATPTWSVVICTRDRPDDLRRCLDSLSALDMSGGEVLVVDNAPAGDATERLVTGYPARYVREGRPGLNWARGRGARSATGEIVIYTDDDVVVDPGWVRAALAPFAAPRVAAVTGLILPLELETEAQELFERYGGFSRGFRRRVFDYTNRAPASAGGVGAGANMALRRELVVGMGLFDVELDCGTAARTGGDAYAFYRLLAEGRQIVYTPDALVWHRHRRDYAALRATLAGYSVGGFAFLLRCLLDHGDWQALPVAASWLRHDHARQLAAWLLRRPGALPLDLIVAQIAAVPGGLGAYLATRRAESEAAPRRRLEAQP